ncbi:MAG: Fluoroacetyl-CoA thioesterase [Pelotomaculum sp. PtaB.Bin013]|uniref:Thioesterase family protein n=1 Tax=Pelotomaculum isophthalicicum JI TaxID=947010 RepID=A0A9X4H3E3_9FIRM|nr:thioesterase family protein [Pelotomaculum isophthalicicum]MDF9409570.1 thioesterase family protein [Pelotomaculum isophthalicicum JI]OPX83035.1 MAG: Fluoroacetyl-CoA thioesterase [Pelotomaculum sp. PtaB.Bin013]
MSGLQVGIEGKASIVVNNDNTAMAYGSGAVNVFATPALIGLMEKAALSSVDPLLDAGYTTVGTKIDVKHLAATPIGMNVTATSRLVEVNGKRLLFNIEVRDEVDLVGTGVHERFIIELSGFIKRVESKAAKQ